jgi:hypothetical protein
MSVPPQAPAAVATEAPSAYRGACSRSVLADRLLGDRLSLANAGLVHASAELFVPVAFGTGALGMLVGGRGRRVERVLGDEIREVDRDQLVDRITELEHLLRAAHADLAGSTKTVAALTEQTQELTEQLEAVRILNQRLIRQGSAMASSVGR